MVAAANHILIDSISTNCAPKQAIPSQLQAVTFVGFNDQPQDTNGTALTSDLVVALGGHHLYRNKTVNRCKLARLRPL